MLPIHSVAERNKAMSLTWPAHSCQGSHFYCCFWLLGVSCGAQHIRALIQRSLNRPHQGVQYLASKCIKNNQGLNEVGQGHWSKRALSVTELDFKEQAGFHLAQLDGKKKWISCPFPTLVLALTTVPFMLAKKLVELINTR